MAHGNMPPHRRAGLLWPLSPFFFAAASVLALMASNLDQTSARDVVHALLGTAAFAALVTALVAAARRRLDAGTTVIASLWVVGALYYSQLFDRLNASLGGDYTMTRALPAAILLLGLLTLACHLLRRAMPTLHLLLTGVSLVMLAFPLWEAGAYAWQERAARSLYDPDEAAAGMGQIAQGAPAGEGTPSPDIYHFIFDRFGSEAMLAREYGIETGINAFLEDRGFYVAPLSHSNYLKTGHSLASTFHLDYLDFLGEAEGLGGRDWRPIFDMLDDHRAGRFLRARGYDQIQFGAWWVGTYDNPVADENHAFGFSEFNMIYLRRTALRPALHLLPPGNFTRRLDWDNAQCHRVGRQVERIKALASDPRPEPIYAFVHILVPHGPYAFTSDGSCLTRPEQAERGESQGYIDQVEYAAHIIKELVPALQEGTRGAPAILVQADEGPFPDRNYRVPWQEATPDELAIKTSILNSYFFPDGDYSTLSPAITPVNSYRMLFNALFGADFERLPDRVIAFSGDSSLYDFHDVTDLATAPDRAAPQPSRRAADTPVHSPDGNAN